MITSANIKENNDFGDGALLMGSNKLLSGFLAAKILVFEFFSVSIYDKSFATLDGVSHFPKFFLAKPVEMVTKNNLAVSISIVFLIIFGL